MLRSFIQITSLMLTLESAIFFAKGSLSLTPKAVAQLSSTKWGYNADLIRSLAEQRADTTIGVVFLVVAFALQILDVFHLVRGDDSAVHKGAAAGAIVSSILLGLAAFFWAGKAARETEARAKHIIEELLRPEQAPPAKRE